MICILAPSKTLEFSSHAPKWVAETAPEFIEQASRINDVLKGLSVEELAVMFHVSTAIAETNYDRIGSWGEVLKPALWAYRGDVYKGMYADKLTQDDAIWAGRHIRIMSGLYGVLRPSDTISPYRLEMKAKIPVASSKDLYGLWKDQLASTVDRDSEGVICNLSSEEYAKPVTKFSSSRIVTPVFMDHKPNGTVGPVPIYSKMMRGVMARWIIDHRIDHPDQLVDFDRFDYIYDASRSTKDMPAFVRSVMTPLVF